MGKMVKWLSESIGISQFCMNNLGNCQMEANKPGKSLKLLGREKIWWGKAQHWWGNCYTTNRRGEYPYCAPLGRNASCVETYSQLHMKCCLLQPLDIFVANWHPYLMITGMALFCQTFSETLARGAIRHSALELRHGRAHLGSLNENAFLRYN